MKTWPALEIRFSPGPGDLPDIVQASLLDFPVTAIDEGSPGAAPLVWRVFFPTAAARDAALERIAGAFDRGQLTASALDVEDEDWAARSQAGVRAVRVGNIVVAPPWDVPQDGEPITIVITPSMGFGTGHHATTRLCLAAMQRIDFANRSVLDVGTGSGVLAIAARRLGASRVLGIDDDPDAIESARENLALNPGVDITLGVTDLRRAGWRPFDVVLANLTGALLVSAANTLKGLSAGRLILSGFQEEEATAVMAAFAGWRVENEAQEDEWRCVTLSITTA